jgi:hypothetical protein
LHSAISDAYSLLLYLFPVIVAFTAKPIGWCVSTLQDAVFQYTRKNSAGTFKFRQVVPNMHWEVVPSPVVEVRQLLQQQQQQQQQVEPGSEVEMR